MAAALYNLGNVHSASGDGASGAAHYGESLRLCRELGDPVVAVECLEGVAELLAGQRLGERAARLLGAAQALRAETGAPLPPVERARHEGIVAAARAGVAREAAFGAAWAEGAAMSLEQAIAYALEEPEERARDAA